MLDLDVDFERPPLAESVIGVQFDPVPGLSAAHLGWFWRECLHGQWQAPVATTPAQDLRENFGALAVPRIHLELEAAPPIRLQTLSSNNSRMIQAQRSRFMVNWIKGNDERRYPRWKALRPEFDALFGKFTGFLALAGLPSIALNQWEVVYVNRVPKGQLWNKVSDFSRIMPDLLGRADVMGPDLSLATLRSTWSYDLPDQRGRLHVETSRQVNRSDAADQVLNLTMTSRGEIRKATGWGYGDGLELGHKAITGAFAKLTSSDAQRHWGRRA